MPYVEERQQRLPGALRGKIRLSDDFDDTPIEFIDVLEGESEGESDRAGGSGSAA